jgi:hypothetical protein
LGLFLLSRPLDAFEGSLDLALCALRHLAPFLLAARFEGSEVMARIAHHARQAPACVLVRGFDLFLDLVEVAAKLT